MTDNSEPPDTIRHMDNYLQRARDELGSNVSIDHVQVIAKHLFDSILSNGGFSRLSADIQESFNSQIVNSSQLETAARRLGHDLDNADLSMIRGDQSATTTDTGTTESESSESVLPESSMTDNTSSSSDSCQVRRVGVKGKPFGRDGQVLPMSLRMRMGIDESWPKDEQDRAVRSLRALVKQACGQDCRETMSYYKDKSLWLTMVMSTCFLLLLDCY